MDNYFSKFLFLVLLIISTNVKAESYCKGYASLWLNDIMWEYNLKSTCKNYRNNNIGDQAPGFFMIKPSKKSMQKARERFFNTLEKEGYKMISGTEHEFLLEYNSNNKNADYCFIATTDLGYKVKRHALKCLDSVQDKLDIYKNGTEFINQGPDTMLEPWLIMKGFYKSGSLDSNTNVYKRIIE